MNVPSTEQMKQFLYGELPESVSREIEERLFVDDDFFQELTGLENDLIDSYIRGKLKGDELRRFERSLALSEERRTHVKDARALQRHIAEHKKANAAPSAVATRQRPAWSRFVGSLSFGLPAMRYAMTALIVLLGAAGAWLLYDNQKVRREYEQAVAEQRRRELEFKGQMAEMERQIEALRLEAEQHAGDKAALEGLNAKLQQREEELAQLKRRQADGPQLGELAMLTPPTIKSVGSRGGSAEEVVGYNPRTVTVRLALDTVTDYKVYEIRKINRKKPFAFGKRVTDSGKSYLLVTLPARSIDFEVWGIDRERDRERAIGKYRLNVPK
jgi:ribosomal protein S15P/S13E